LDAFSAEPHSRIPSDLTAFSLNRYSVFQTFDLLALDARSFPLAVFGIVWEFPTMKADNAVTKLDSRLRGIFPSDFAPGDVLEREIPERLDPARIAAAIRADRDSR
jgi:hypothetical protein